MAKDKVFTKGEKLLLDGKIKQILTFESYGEELNIFECCESPIETALLFELVDLFKNFSTLFHGWDIEIKPQKEMPVPFENYRADIAIDLIDYTYEKIYHYAIECDGHDWHEKTKEQVRKDRKREREIMKTDYQVIRFAGSEIFEEPAKCAADVWEIIRRKMPSTIF